MDGATKVRFEKISFDLFKWYTLQHLKRKFLKIDPSFWNGGPTLATLTHGDLNHLQQISSAFGGQVAKWNFSFEKFARGGGGIFQKQNAGSYAHFIISRDTCRYYREANLFFNCQCLFMSVNSLRAGHSKSKCSPKGIPEK